MQITHEEAHRFIQFNTDKALDSQGKAALSVHLKDCMECRAYAEDIEEMAGLLQSAMKRQWNFQPVPLSISAFTAKKVSKIQRSVVLATRTAMAGIVFVALVFTAWQFALSGGPTFGQLPAGVLPVPTPSTQSTSTKIMLQNCEVMLYGVQKDDTLASIAYQFSIAREEIMSINNMKTETVDPSMKLMIPICDSTPTGTVNPATLTTTYTPVVDPTTSTPGG